MSAPDLNRLERKIKEALDLISTLRAENASIKNELKEVKKSLGEKVQGAKGGEKDKGQLIKYKEELKRLQSERVQAKQMIRNVLKKIEGIQLKEQKVQRELFDKE